MLSMRDCVEMFASSGGSVPVSALRAKSIYVSVLKPRMLLGYVVHGTV